MPKQRTPSQPLEILSRTIRVDSAGLGVTRHAEKRRGEAARFADFCWIELWGEADEPLRDICEFGVSVHESDREEPGTSVPPSVGAIIQIKPTIQAVVQLASSGFDRAWMLAVSGQLRYCYLAFTRPVRRSALIVSASFSNEPEEE